MPHALSNSEHLAGLRHAPLDWGSMAPAAHFAGMTNPFLIAISALNSAGSRYVIVGGFAAFLHGTRRVTVDLDVIVYLEATQARKTPYA